MRNFDNFLSRLTLLLPLQIHVLIINPQQDQSLHRLTIQVAIQVIHQIFSTTTTTTFTRVQLKNTRHPFLVLPKRLPLSKRHHPISFPDLDLPSTLRGYPSRMCTESNPTVYLSSTTAIVTPPTGKIDGWGGGVCVQNRRWRSEENVPTTWGNYIININI